METESDTLLAYKRSLKDQNLVVLCNLSDREQQIQIDSSWIHYRRLLYNYSGQELEEEKKEFYTMKPYEFIALGNMRF